MFHKIRTPGVVCWECVAALAMLSTSAAAAPPTPVPPTLEIAVLDPNVDPQGNPAIVVRNDGRGGAIVDIPPVVLVHRYYYTGDRSFQGPMLPGGPSIVVVNDPRTGERCYIPVQMLPGAPVVRYTGRKIEYDYGRNGITVSFGMWGTPKVTYRNRVPVTRMATQVATGATKGVGAMAQQSGIPRLTRSGVENTRNLAVNAKHGIEDLGGGLLAPVCGLVNSTPLGAIFASNPEDNARRKRDAALRRAAEQQAKASISLPTIR
ncbi:MAG: hypothetical protein HQ567_23705 [Candidatus Nealsonbacteria bacterium]|nr:hypothetical protein [Candidatus Nealsonbacteria bacterium]